jgi:plastocyanin
MTRIAAFAVLAAMAAPGPGVAAAKPPAHRTVTVVIDKLAFGPLPSGLRVGDTIQWVNRDIFRHSVTANGHFNLDLAAGTTGRLNLGRAGEFPFTCKYHPGMKSVLKVNP